MLRCVLLGTITFCLTNGLLYAQRNDRQVAEAQGWIYDDLAKGLAEAKRLDKPLMVVIRCPP